MKKERIKLYILVNALFILLLTILGFFIVFKLNNVSIKSIFAHFAPTNVEEDSNPKPEPDEIKDMDNNDIVKKETPPTKEQNPLENETQVVDEDVYETITISAAGDVTLGRDEDYGYERSFDHELTVQNNDYSYFFRNVKDIFEEDDLTIVNLETTLTTAIKKADKKFRFKADPSYVEILKEGSIEVVSIANNHTHDYLEQGYLDTMETLENAGVGYFGYEHSYMKDIRGIKVGVLGFNAWNESDELKETIKTSIENLKEEGADLIIIMYHWGIERDHYPNSTQRNIAHFSIDHGADLILGGHPHVLQGVEEYKGKQIIYSLANFSFGGNKNPKDKDTMVYVHKFNFKNGELVSEEGQVIPASISSVTERNNYQPTPLEGEEKERVLKRIEEYSAPYKE